MGTLMQSEVKLKIDNFDDLNFNLKEQSKNLKFGLDFKFYQKLFLILLASCIFLIFPESPKNSEILCKRFHPIEACIVW